MTEGAAAESTSQTPNDIILLYFATIEFSHSLAGAPSTPLI
ncbi:MAG: hypothetical protein QOH05_3954, partial [Acetobacteraceae bacterium]|nr:hypothetical protein [Acetobacteraceae bacterium]